MGDRTSVRLLLLTEQLAFAQSVVDLKAEGASEWNEIGIFSECLFEEVNYGNLEFLPKLLEAGIPFESAWSDGCEYFSGTSFGRFLPDGTAVTQDIFDIKINPDLDELKKRLHRPRLVVEFIEKHIREITPIPWDNQIEYGKLHRATKLITPKQETK